MITKLLNSVKKPMASIPGSDIAIHPTTLKSPTEVVYVEYEPGQPLPPKPGDDWTRFVCISDTHNRSFPVPDGDVLLHSGDLTDLGRLSDFKLTMNWLYSLTHKTKIIIAGNHDLALHKDWYETHYTRFHGKSNKQDYDAIHDLLTGSKARKTGIVYLEDESYTFRTKEGGREWSVYGSPWSPWFHNWAFNYTAEEAEALVAKFPKTDILLTHGPPYHIFDRTNTNDLPGCPALRRRLPSLRPRIHLFGHIHEDHGARIHGWKEDPSSSSDPSFADLPPMHALSLLELEAEREMLEDESEHELPEDESDPERRSQYDPGHPPPTHDEDLKNAKERTVFVNAAAWPMGKLAWREVKGEGETDDDGDVNMGNAPKKTKTPFGGPGFQPVVVDLKD
ncbi:Metallo-dependent phosphatase [Schizophyllum commune H4-8]|uniref:Calcineurin-like phosphoesterase domain-containing protein n=1 Tax=Schizophyllum commune (strain H4-8 / FGSC 9210) TaxID=578458 RepID=D8Q4E0_SCHCM|nr:Metallo-dependent phosphatase [Schizophyllum commune H4-8]KAI5892653.1 Metallo-dependent phosphatase [Schizophyllum commune H4-8]